MPCSWVRKHQSGKRLVPASFPAFLPYKPWPSSDSNTRFSPKAYWEVVFLLQNCKRLIPARILSSVPYHDANYNLSYVQRGFKRNTLTILVMLSRRQIMINIFFCISIHNTFLNFMGSVLIPSHRLTPLYNTWPVHEYHSLVLYVIICLQAFNSNGGKTLTLLFPELRIGSNYFYQFHEMVESHGCKGEVLGLFWMTTVTWSFP